MASWLERGRPAIFKALQEVCDRIDGDLANELQERDAQQHTFLTKEVERLQARVAAVDKLEGENRALRDEVTVLHSQLKTASSNSVKLQAAATPQPARQPLGEISTNTPSRASTPKLNPKEITEDSKAAKRLAALQKEFDRVVAQRGQQSVVKAEADAKLRSLREQRDKWEKYAGKLEAKVKKLKSERDHGPDGQPQSPVEPTRTTPGLETSRAANPATTISVSTSKATLGSQAPPQTLASSSFSGFEHRVVSSPRRATSTPPDARPSDFADNTANSTQGDDDIREDNMELPRLPPNDTRPVIVPIKNEPSSDLPVIVSEKRVGKRKHPNDLLDERTPRRVKAEERSSDPLVTGESHHFSPQESLDLDIDGTMPTPRKIRMLQEQDRSDELIRENDNMRARSSEFDVSKPRSRNGPRDVVQAPHASVRNLRVYASPVTKSGSGTLWRPPGGGSKLNDGVASLAEDGYDPTRSGKHGQTEDQSADAHSRATRLDTLLNRSSPTPQEQTPLLRPNRQLRDTSRSSPWLSETPARVLPFGRAEGTDSNVPATSRLRLGNNLDSAPASAKAAPRLQTPRTATPGTAKSKAKPHGLRSKPLSSLRLEDFKINPKFNNGHDYAFTEVVRNKDERADLPGCVDPDCCGKHFRAMAKSELEAAGPSLIHRAADIALLEDYLGDQVYKLGSMTRQEKEELWLEAKTRELANKHGKHRHRFTRRQSPPGFWDTDFPTTQDNERDRAEGEKREKRQIEERYREAVRDGGRWLFRDES